MNFQAGTEYKMSYTPKCVVKKKAEAKNLSDLSKGKNVRKS